MTKNIEEIKTLEKLFGGQLPSTYPIVHTKDYPTEQIDKLMSEGKVDDAQQLYFKYIKSQRRGLIRL